MLLRVLSAIVLIGLVSVIVFLAPPLVLAGAILVFCGFCFYEFLLLGNRIFPPIDPWLTLLVAIPAGFLLIFPIIPRHREAGLIAFVLILGVRVLFTAGKMEEVLSRLVWPVFGFTYVFLLLSYAQDIRFDCHATHGPWLLLFFLLLQWIGDTAAFLAGKSLGRHKLAPAISPGKTIEGTVAGLAGSALTGAGLAVFLFPEKPVWLFALLGLAAGGVGQMGDLLESMFKRTAGVKDSSNLIPGHGGFFDRMDSLILTAPLVYAGLKLLL